jgi:hypothetical protein
VLVIFNPGQYQPTPADFTNGLLSASSNIPASHVLAYYAHVTQN